MAEPMICGALTPSDLRILSRMTLLESLAPSEFDEVAAAFTVSEFGRDEPLFETGTPATQVFGILSGWVKLRRQSLYSTSTVLDMCTVGETLAETEVALQGVHTGVAVSADVCRVSILDQDMFHAFLQRMPNFQIGLITSIERHFDKANAEIGILRTLSGQQRLIQFLLKLANGQRAPIALRLPFEKVLIAEHLGMTPESLSRNFAKLRSQGVRVQGRSVRIEDPSQLRRLLISGTGERPLQRPENFKHI